MATIQSLEMHFLSIINIKNSKIKFEQNCDNAPSKHSYLLNAWIPHLENTHQLSPVWDLNPYNCKLVAIILVRKVSTRSCPTSMERHVFFWGVS